MKITNKYWFISLVALLLLLAYGQTFNFPFQFDDYNVIVDAPKVHSLSAWWQSMPGMRPLLKLSYALNWQLESAPRFFRTFNLIGHFVSSILVWRLCLELLPYLQKDIANRNQIACLTAILFALHPAHTEVVTYISSRSTGLMTLLCLASLICFLRHFKLQDNHKSAYLFASILLWLLAILVKEPAMILPLIACLMVRLIAPNYRFIDAFNQAARRKKWLSLLVFVAPTSYILLTPQYVDLLAQIFTLNNVKTQWLSQSVAHNHYLTKTLFGSTLNIDYQLFIPATLISLSGLYMMLILAVVGFALFYFKQRPLLCFCVLWWFICLMPSNSIIPRLDLVNDRQIYMASIGALLLVSMLIFALADLLRKFKLFWLLPILIVAASFFVTWQRNWDYASETSLWLASVQQAPKNARAWNNLGYAYMLDQKNEKAILAFEKALKLDDTNYKAFYNLQQLKRQ